MATGWRSQERHDTWFHLALGLKILVWYEHYYSMPAGREKQVKRWKRVWKISLVESINPAWLHLHNAIDVTATLVEEEAGPQLSPG